jgi:hypothetical protein
MERGRGPLVDGMGTVCWYGSEVDKQHTKGLKWQGMKRERWMVQKPRTVSRREEVWQQLRVEWRDRHGSEIGRQHLSFLVQSAGQARTVNGKVEGGGGGFFIRWMGTMCWYGSEAGKQHTKGLNWQGMKRERWMGPEA